MKRVTRKQRERTIRLNVRSRKEGKRRAGRERDYNLQICRYHKLEVPPVISIYWAKHRDRVLDFVLKFKSAIITGQRRILVDFSQTEKIHAGGMILLYAEINRCVNQYDDTVSFRCKPPRKNEKVAQVLVQLGLAKLFGETIPHRPKFDDVVSWRVATGSQVDGQKYDDVLGAYDGVIPDELSKGFFRGITEAMTNVRQHAYIKPKNDLIPLPAGYNKWWMFSQKKDGKLTVIFCDLGLGIPKTIPLTRPQVLKKLVTLGLAENDAATIEGTIEDSRSRTGLKHRGKGLPQIIDSVKSVNGAAGIYSNKGRYQSGEPAKKTSYKRSVDGTIIFWRVDAPEEQKHVNH